MAIGDQRPSRQIVQAPNPRVSESAFGSGVATGLRNIAQAQLQLDASQTELQAQEKRAREAFRGRELKIERARASASLVGLRSDLAQETEQLRREWEDPFGRGFTEEISQRVQRRAEEFQSNLPEELKTEFEPRLAQLRATFETSAFETELDAGDTAFQKATADITQTAVDEILSGQTTLEKVTQELDMFLDTSPLSQGATDELAKEVFSSLQMAAFSVEAGASAQDPLSERGSLPAPDPATGIYATGMPAEATGFLNAIGGVESGNEYNRLFSHDGKRTFDDFSEHPNSPARIKKGPNKGDVSTAAGRYQIIKPTWDRAAEALGLEDFSPANQDRAAWWIAQEAYTRMTGGDSIQQALRSGDPVRVEKVRRVLSGESGSGVTYEGLQNMSSEDFYQQATGGQPTPGAIVNDPRFDNIPFTDRMSVYTDALNAESERQAQLAQQRQASRQNVINETIANINLGRAGMSDIMALQENYSLSAQETERVSEAFDKKFAAQISAQKFQARLAGPGPLAFEPGDTTDMEQLNNYANESFVETFQQRDADGFNNTVIPTIAATRAVPNIAVQSLIQDSRSADPQVAEFGLRAMQSIFETDPQAFERAFGSDRTTMIRSFTGSQLRGQSVAEFQETVRARQTDPRFFEQVETQLSQARKDNPGKFLPKAIAQEAFGKTAIGGMIDRGEVTFGNQGQMLALSREYNAIKRSAMLTAQDADEAHEIAIEELKGRFGVTEQGSEDYLLRRPPEQFYPPVNGSHRWLEQQTRSDLNLPEDQAFRLVSDGQTEADIQAGRQPSYKVFLEDNGVFSPAMRQDEQAPAAGAGPIYPARVAFQRTPEMVGLEIDKVLLKDEVYSLREEEEFIRAQALEAGAGTDEDRRRLQEIRDLIREKERLIEEKEEAFR